MNELWTKHIYTEKAWVHVVSPEPVLDDVCERLLYANELLCAQYAVRVPKFIQVSSDWSESALETENGVGLVRYPDLDVLSETFLVSDEMYVEFSKFHSEPEEYKGLDAVLQWHHRHWGLICAVVHEGEVYEHFSEEAVAVSVIEPDSTEGDEAQTTAGSSDGDEHGT